MAVPMSTAEEEKKGRRRLPSWAQATPASPSPTSSTGAASPTSPLSYKCRGTGSQRKWPWEVQLRAGTVFVGHSGANGTARTAGAAHAAQAGGQDDHALLIGPGEGGGGEIPQWQVRPPEQLATLPARCGVRHMCFLWDWTAGANNLARAWKAHHHPVTCLATIMMAPRSSPSGRTVRSTPGVSWT